ncbi:tRNA (adenosine(37)-N6)-dimethylallyltransferase MiaA [Limnoglobus roseus]|uniref:tRNA dimethylallyltransferase n=1 Tax=Limnoglobus roseus TaxID=2598579 RepID=A0A5C1AAV1_9BACT|nr:tRNA (adenosine(37)-N6)-dimethylallyltransferase MiaA [Limnoglobus roseus]QEL15850.1 tRNA (adenosine(37)-N6)-dimethylallyltransferase MiaA [Limnoglobus roseus]
MHDFADALILTGPTASGKTAIAVELAERIGAEVLAMDSMTLYRGLDIGTAKPTPAEQACVRHHLIDLLDPWESANVAWWLDQATKACADIRSRGKRPLFVGGTPFYLKALLHGLFDAPPSDAILRQQLEAEAATLGNEHLHAKLATVDAKSAARLHPNDVRRVVRALEVFHLTGAPLSAFQQTWDSPTFGNDSPAAAIPCVNLEWPREVLYERINRRVETMVAGGWLDEVRGLIELSQPLSREASHAVGYAELIAHVQHGRPTLAEAVAQIQQRTRQFAKRQMTWFRGLKACHGVPAGEPEAAERVLAAWGI